MLFKMAQLLSAHALIGHLHVLTIPSMGNKVVLPAKPYPSLQVFHEHSTFLLQGWLLRTRFRPEIYNITVNRIFSTLHVLTNRNKIFL